MDKPYEVVPVPRASANDDSGVLVAWRVKDGDPVASGDILCELEFSKSIVEVTAPRDGFAFRLDKEGNQVTVGKPLAVVGEAAQRPALEMTERAVDDGVKITAKARTLIDQHSLDPTLFAGHAIVKERHVLAYLDQCSEKDDSSVDGEFTPLSALRRRSAQTLSESVRTIPHSQVTRWIDANRVDETTERLATQHDQMISLSDRLVEAVAKAARRFTTANASWHDNGILRHAKVHVGFAMNQANGDLLVPVIPDADTRDLPDIVAQIRSYQKLAIRHKLTPDQLSGGTITVTSLVGTGAQQVNPIILPPQAAIVALGDRRDVGHGDYALTVAFDHRILNGAEAAELATAIGNSLESGGEPR